jgi:hypothetical protein
MRFSCCEAVFSVVPRASRAHGLGARKRLAAGYDSPGSIDTHRSSDDAATVFATTMAYQTFLLTRIPVRYRAIGDTARLVPPARARPGQRGTRIG